MAGCTRNTHRGASLSGVSSLILNAVASREEDRGADVIFAAGERDKSLKAAANYDDTTGIRECQKTLEASKKASRSVRSTYEWTHEEGWRKGGVVTRLLCELDSATDRGRRERERDRERGGRGKRREDDG